MNTDLFQYCGHFRVFWICWHIECSALTTSSFRIWTSSAGTPSTPLVLCIVILPKALLPSHSRVSGSRCMATRSWLSQSLNPFLYGFFVYSCHLFLVSAASFRSFPFLSFIVTILAWNVPLVFCFPEDISNFSHFNFPSLYLHCSLKRPSYLSLPFSRTVHSVGYVFPYLPCFLLLSFYFSQLFVKSP